MSAMAPDYVNIHREENVKNTILQYAIRPCVGSVARFTETRFQNVITLYDNNITTIAIDHNRCPVPR